MVYSRIWIKRRQRRSRREQVKEIKGLVVLLPQKLRLSGHQRRTLRRPSQSLKPCLLQWNQWKLVSLNCYYYLECMLECHDLKFKILTSIWVSLNLYHQRNLLRLLNQRVGELPRKVQLRLKRYDDVFFKFLPSHQHYCPCALILTRYVLSG